MDWQFDVLMGYIWYTQKIENMTHMSSGKPDSFYLLDFHKIIFCMNSKHHLTIYFMGTYHMTHTLSRFSKNNDM